MASKSETCPAEVGQGPNGAPEAQEQPLFIECASFEGAREGYVYKMDDAGLGYYRDIPLEERMAAARVEARSKPVVVKANNSLLKSLQKRAPVAIPSGVPKKAKTDEKDKSTPAYIKEMERYKSMSCASDGKDKNRPLVK